MRAATPSSFAFLLLLAGCPGQEPCEETPCIDNDGDGVCADCCPGRPCDCDDGDALVHPGARDVHRDDFDFDCDGTDLGGSGTPCVTDGECSRRCNPDLGTCTAFSERCDGSDADGDGRAGCADFDCASACDDLVTQACAEATEIDGVVNGTFVGAPPLSSQCGALAPQRIHRIDPAGPSGELVLSFSGLDSLELRSECELPAGPGCLDVSTGAASLVVDGEPLFALASGEGSYSLSWQFTAALCGDAITIAPEECDDGDAEGGDGCDASCRLEPGFDPCALAIETPLGLTSGATAGGSSVSQGSCGGSEAVERVHRIVPASSGILQLSVEGDGPLAVYARDASCQGPELACESGPSIFFSLDDVAGQPHFVLVDGATPGPPVSYTLVAHLIGP